MTKATSENVRSYTLGLNKGFVVTKIEKKARPADRKAKTSKRVRSIRKLMHSVCDMSPFEKKITEMFKTGINKVEKRAFRLLKKRLGSRERAKKRQEKINHLIKEMTKKEAKKEQKK